MRHLHVLQFFGNFTLEIRVQILTNLFFQWDRVTRWIFLGRSTNINQCFLHNFLEEGTWEDLKESSRNFMFSNHPTKVAKKVRNDQPSYWNADKSFKTFKNIFISWHYPFKIAVMFWRFGSGLYFYCATVIPKLKLEVIRKVFICAARKFSKIFPRYCVHTSMHQKG